MKIRGTPTDSLADIIQSLQFIRKSGLLTAQRDSPGNNSELGTIVFHEGQVITANVGQLKGMEAYRKLITWQTCRFMFEANHLSTSSPPSSGLATAGQNSLVAERRHKEAPLNEYTSTSIVPYRSQHTQNVIPNFQHFGLARIHRQLFLLIDGTRTSQELARLIGRNPQETLVLLADLENMNFIGH